MEEESNQLRIEDCEHDLEQAIGDLELIPEETDKKLITATNNDPNIIGIAPNNYVPEPYVSVLSYACKVFSFCGHNNIFWITVSRNFPCM